MLRKIFKTENEIKRFEESASIASKRIRQGPYEAINARVFEYFSAQRVEYHT